jgi:hypothetical protein
MQIEMKKEGAMSQFVRTIALIICAVVGISISGVAALAGPLDKSFTWASYHPP